MRYAGEHEDLGDVLEADDAHKDRVWRLGGPAQEYSAPGLPQRKYASVAMAREGLDCILGEARTREAGNP
jgi:hypothetical protein